MERYGQAAFISAIAVLGSGLISAAGRLAAKGGGWSSLVDALTEDAYGALLIAKVAAFVLLVVLAAIHRARSDVDLLDSGGPFWRVVGVELLVMALTLGLSVALSQTA